MNASVSDPDTVGKFLAAMEAVGMKPLEPIAARLGSGLIRFRADGDGPDRRNGWAVLHLDGVPAGAFGSFKLGVTMRWRADRRERLPLGKQREQAMRWREERAKREIDLLDQQRRAAERCVGLWDCARVVDPAHSYLVRKGIAGEGLKQDRARLLIPMFDATGALWNVQAINGEGVKRFQKGARQHGLHLLLGAVNDRLVIAEGYATGAVVRRATALPVAIAFSARNLAATALLMRGSFPDAEITIAADDDAHLACHPRIQRNIGLDEAKAAARAVGGRVAIPPRRAS